MSVIIFFSASKNNIFFAEMMCKQLIFCVKAATRLPNLVVKYKILTERAFKTGRKEIPLQSFLTCFAASSNKLYLPTMYAYRVYPAMSKSPKTTTKLSGYSRNKSRSNLCQLPVYPL